MAMRDAKEQKMHDTIVRSLKTIYAEQKNASQVITNLDGPDAVHLSGSCNGREKTNH